MSACRHRQSEPVILSTGEQVACICISCFASLPAGWIEGQRVRAYREAHCEHEWIDVSTFGQLPGSHRICGLCGIYVMDDEPACLPPAT